MRAPIFITIITIMILCTVYILQMHIKDKEKENKDKEKENKEIEQLKKYSNNMLMLALFTSVSGTLIFIIVLKLHLGNKFSIIQFIKGSRDQECYVSKIRNKILKYGLFFDFHIDKDHRFMRRNHINFLPHRTKKKMSMK